MNAPVDGETDEPLLDENTLSELAVDIGLDGVLEAIKMFLEDGPGRIAGIRQALTDRQPGVMRREVHALAGAARIVGLLRLGRAAYAMQLSLESREPDAAVVEALVALAEKSLAAAFAWEQARAG